MLYNMCMLMRCKMLLFQNHLNGSTLSVNDIVSAIGSSSTTFCGLTYVSDIKPKACFKHVSIKKVVNGNVQLFSNIKKANPYLNRINKQIANTGKTYQLSNTWYEHDSSCYSIVRNKRTFELYLYGIFNNYHTKKVLYFVDNNQVKKEDVYQYLTPSAVKGLMVKPNRSLKNDIEHNVFVRVIKIGNVLQINVNGKSISV